MASTQERTCLESFLLSLAVVVATWPFRISKGLSASPKIENITIDEPVRAGCCGFNVDMRWNISALPKNDIPSFKIWLTHENQQIRNTSVIEPNGNNSFEFTFLRLCPARKYTAHIASYDASMENITSNGNITFDVKPILDRMKTNNSADNGYVMVNWGLSKIARSLGTQVVYKISICPEGRNKSPSICHNNTLEMCKATYNASSDSGHVELYEQNWLNYRGPDSNLNINQPLLKSWNSKERRFTCGIFLNACTTWRRGFRQTFQFDVEYGACSTPPQYERVSLQKGYSSKPDTINITHLNTRNSNQMAVKVAWRFRVVCQENPAVSFRIFLKTTQGKTTSQRHFREYDFKFRGETNFLDLIPFSTYSVVFETETLYYEMKVNKTTNFMTREGVPTKAPLIQPIVGVHYCDTENRRNVTVSWTLPPQEEWNGKIRNVVLRYSNKKSPKDVREILLESTITSTVITGLHCYAEYLVQAKACIRGNESCSEYSKGQIIQTEVSGKIASARTSGSFVTLYASIGGGVLLIVVALAVCFYIYRRWKRKSFPQLTENLENTYYLANERTLSETGEYSELPPPDE